MRDTILRASWWTDCRLDGADAETKLVLLFLHGMADRDGIVQADTTMLMPLLRDGSTRLTAVTIVRSLEARGVLALWTHNDIMRGSQTWAWLVRQHEDQMPSGALALPRCMDRPSPPRELVLAVLSRQLGREATAAEGKRASPRSWGLVRAATTSAADNVQTVWSAWRDRQVKPAACVLAEPVQRTIRSALQQASADQLVALFRFAYEADEAAARFWRGQNEQRRTYLGIDNLLRQSKLADRLQLVEAWLASQQTDGGDGTDLGPLAAYRRRGPAGTTTSPDPRPARLGAQCDTMLRLFVARADEGVRTHELAGLALKYSSRISELRGMGADIVVTERHEDGDNVYALLNIEHIQHLLVGGTDGVD